MLKRILFFLVGAIALGTVAFGVFAWRPSLPKIAQPAVAGFSPGLVRQGEKLAAAGACAGCHTVRGGQPYAGGVATASRFGTVYSTNITPDRRTGIGGWSEAAFERAMRRGVRRDGAHLFPAFPYEHFSKLTDSDVAALYAFVMTRAPVVASERSPTIPWPLNIRALQAGWKVLFVQPGGFVPDRTQSAAWNRGAYLAEGITHCGTCHTPRGALGGERRDRAYAGGVVNGRVAPAPLPSRDALIAYLSNGFDRDHATAGGASGGVPDGLSGLSRADIVAIATYLASRASQSRPASRSAR